jgi:hypothetical protein
MSRTNLYVSILKVLITNHVQVLTFNHLAQDNCKQKSVLESNNHRRFVVFLKINNVKWAIVANRDKVSDQI